MKIMLYEWDAFMQRDMEDVCKRLGIDCQTFWYPFMPKLTTEDKYFEKHFGRILADGGYDAVFSFNFKSVVAKCAKTAGIPYIAWVFDSPFGISEDREILSYPTNHIFVFDRYVYNRLISEGVETVYHLPLAVNLDRLDAIVTDAEDEKRYGADVSFVGTLYGSTFSGFANRLPEYEKGMIDAVIEAQMKLYGGYFLDVFTEGHLTQRLYEILEDENGQYDHIFHESLQSLLCKEITRRERLTLLYLLGEMGKVALYTNQSEDMLANVENRGVIDSYSEVYKVYKTTKINLNISFKRIVEGIPLRCMDIMGAGGFLLSNYQPELVENFEPGVECEVYESMEDAATKVQYYLTHEDERAEIARRGHERMKEFTFEKQLKLMFETCGIRVNW